MFAKLLSVLIVLSVIYPPVTTFAATLQTTSVIDTYINQSVPDASYSNSNSLWVSNNAINKQERILLKFDISSIPANSTINSSKVELWQEGGDGASPAQIDIARITSNWDGGVTWNTKPAIAVPDSLIFGDKGLGKRMWHMDEIVESWVGGSTNYGVEILYSDNAPRVMMNRSYTGTANDVARRPALYVDYTPPALDPIILGNLDFNPVIPNINPGNLPQADLKITEIKVENLSSTGTTIKWKTNKNASTWIFYGNATDGSDRFDLQSGKDELAANHQINLANLTPGVKYSFKVMSKTADNKQKFGEISYFTTNASLASVAPSPSAKPSSSSNPLTGIQDKIENKVADYAISESLDEENVASVASDSGSVMNDIALESKTKNPLILIAGQMGINKLAGILLIILAFMCLIGAFILYKISWKVHHHIRKHLDGVAVKSKKKK